MNLHPFCIPDLNGSLTVLLRQIPSGRATTYGTLADALGSRSAARWVGEFMVDHPHGVDCPCHRVVRSTGEPGLFIGGDESEKLRRLQADSVPYKNGRVDLAACGMSAEEFASSRPLARLIDVQHELAESVVLQPFAGTPDVVAAVDVSYPAEGRAVAAYVLVEAATGKLIWSTAVERRSMFPYVPGFLTFRELPAMLELFEKVGAEDRRAELLFVDGNGILHPRRAGIAACVGVLTCLPTIGVGKKLLLGSVDLKSVTPHSPQPVTVDGQQVGVALKSAPSSRPVFVSPGHLMNVADAARLARIMFHGHRVPEPIYHADAVSRRSRSERLCSGGFQPPNVT